MSYLSKFRDTHLLTSDANLACVLVGVNALYECNELVQEALESATSRGPKQSFLNEAYKNLTARIYEQADGMLVCIAAQLGPSAEALARVVIESSVNLIYLSMHGLEAPLLGYFECWLNAHNRTLTEWKEHESNSDQADIVTPIINRRLEALSGLRKFFDSAVEELRLDHQPVRDVWPKSLFRRFEAIGKKSDYYTSYHRLSSSSHLAAEETLTWLFGYSLMNPTLMQKLSLEAVSYSIMMSRVAVIFYIDGVAACCIAHNLRQPLETLRRHKSELTKSVEHIAEDAGCPK